MRNVLKDPAFSHCPLQINSGLLGMEELLTILPMYLLFLAATCCFFHARETRMLRASVYAGFSTGAATTISIIAFDQRTWNPLPYLVGFLVYGLGLAFISSFLAWILGVGFCNLRR